MITPLSHRRLFTVIAWGTLLWFSIFSITGCSGSQQSSGASAPPAGNVIYDKTFSKPYDKTYEAVLKVLRNRGFVLSLSDKSSGILNAEWYSASPMEEDSVDSSLQKETGPNPLLVFLSIILIFGIILIIIDAASSGSTSDQSSSDKGSSDDEKEHYRHHHHDDNDAPASTIGYKYIAGLRFLSVNDTTTKMELNYTKIVIQNGTPTYSGPIRSAVTAKIFFEALENELYFVQ